MINATPALLPCSSDHRTSSWDKGNDSLHPAPLLNLRYFIPPGLSKYQKRKIMLFGRVDFQFL
jgi:hypothetical protein